MFTQFDFAHPWALLLLPLAVLPLLRRRRDTLPFSYAPWLPKDPLGQIAGWMWRILAAIAIFSTVIALAGLGRPQTQVARVGRGAEILILVDRRRSMADHMLPDDWRKIDRCLLIRRLA